MTALSPYPAETVWTTRHRNGHERTGPLELWWEVSTSPFSDDYLPEETDARELWGMWIDYVVNSGSWAEKLGRPWMHIGWYVWGPGEAMFEGAPHQIEPWPEDFLTFFSRPWNDEYGEVNWLRVPVKDYEWQPGAATKGGFIQEATGWKPSPLQRFVNLEQIAMAAGLGWRT